MTSQPPAPRPRSLSQELDHFNKMANLAKNIAIRSKFPDNGQKLVLCSQKIANGIENNPIVVQAFEAINKVSDIVSGIVIPKVTISDLSSFVRYNFYKEPRLFFRIFLKSTCI